MLEPERSRVSVSTARHRNNAAEWALWVLLWPAVPVVWLIERVRTRRSR